LDFLAVNQKTKIAHYSLWQIDFYGKLQTIRPMPYNLKLADRVRDFLATRTGLKIEEKKMFRGLTFMVDEKMCVSVSKDNLMCRYDPLREHEIAERIGFQPMIMKGRQYKGFCYVGEEGYKSKKDFEFWLNLCLDYNGKAKKSKKK
jgi:hypothetical protein